MAACCCSPCCYISKRYLTIIQVAIGMCVVHAMRTNVAVTVVTILDKAPHRKVGTKEAITQLPNVDWDSHMIGFLHSVFYIGYIITQIPGGYLATQIASNRLFGGCILISCSLNLLVPVSIDRMTYPVTCVIRLCQGLAEGVLFPSAYAVLRHWSIPSERGRMGSMVLTGVYIGPVIGLPAAGVLTHYLGWQYVFYLSGGLGIVWFLFWLFLSHETPAHHPDISEEELMLMEKEQGDSAIIYEQERVPWAEIVTSLPVWSLCVCHFARSFIFFLLLTNGPTYLNVFHFSIAENGIYSSLPHLLMTLLSAASGPIADCMLRNPMLTITDIRKMLTCVGFGTKAACFLFLVFVVDGVSALIFLTLGVGAGGLTISGWHINHLDLAPRYASVLVGMSSSCGTFAGILTPIITGAMTTAQAPANQKLDHVNVGETVEEWHYVFLLCFFVLAFAVVFYGIFGSGEKQPWAEPVGAGKVLISKTALPRPDYQTVKPQESAEVRTPPSTAKKLPPDDAEDDKIGESQENATTECGEKSE